MGLERTTSDHDRCAVVCCFGSALDIRAVLVRDPLLAGVTDLTFRLLSIPDLTPLPGTWVPVPTVPILSCAQHTRQNTVHT